MKPGYQERLQVYVLGPNQDSRLASVAAGATLTVALTLDLDAPFLMRGRCVACRPVGDTSGMQSPLEFLYSQFSGPRRNFFGTGPIVLGGQSFVPATIESGFFGQQGGWLPVVPEVFYPKGSTLYVQFQNNGTAAITNLTFYFLGVKQYSWGEVVAYTYPKRCAMLPFIYPLNVTGLAVSGASAQSLNNIFTCKDDADFVFRAAVWGRSAWTVGVGVASQVFWILYDEQKKPYMNDWVWLGAMFPATGFSNGACVQYEIGNAESGGNLQNQAVGASNPGLVYPEIYIPNNHLIYYDVKRDDSFNSNAQGTVTLDILLMGAKVFKR
jgi:hypothetical protein